LKIDNFNTSFSGNLNQMFFHCSSLISLNIVNFDHSSVTRNINRMFEGINKDIIFCLNESNVPKIVKLINEEFNNSYINDCSYNCFSSTNSKIIEEQKICVTDCSNNKEFRYEYGNICYKTCPNNTHISSDNFTCENDNETMVLLKNFDVNKFFNGSYHINDSDPFVKDQIINIIKENIKSGKINLTDLIEGEQNDYILKEADVIYQITSTENQKNKKYDMSTIQLGQCEGILKEKYNISKELPLIIFKVEYSVPGIQIPVIGYNVFHPNNKTKLDLKYCKDSIINFDIPVSIDENELIKYDPNSEYYTNECFSYTTDNKTDIILEDRQYEYNNNNFSLCENKCSFSEYDRDSKKVECNCNATNKEFIISEILKDENILSSYNFIDKSPSLNVYTMKCIYTLFTEEGLKSNIGNYIMILITIIFIILIILFYKVSYELLLEDIQRLIKDAEKKEDITKNNKIIKKSIRLKKRKKSEKNLTIYSKNKIRVNIKKYTQNINSSNIKSSKSTKVLKLFNSSNDDNINSFDFKENVKSNKINNNNYNDYELNSLSFEKALEDDKRTFFQYYFSLLRTKHPIIFLFNTIYDYNSRIIKFSIFLLLFSIIYILNALFYNEDSVHRIYENQGQYDFKFFLPQILYSFLISQVLFISIKYFSLSEKDIIKVKNDPKNEEKVKKVQQCLFIKYILFYILGLIFIIFFWYYLSSFCAVFVNSQIFLIDNTIICLSISLLYPFFINFLPCAFRIISLNKENKFFYKVSKILQLI
jgi:surface protein